jgi:hypothetical protein
MQTRILLILNMHTTHIAMAHSTTLCGGAAAAAVLVKHSLDLILHFVQHLQGATDEVAPCCAVLNRCG